MTNLIPPDAQIQVKREYHLRVATVWLVLFSCALLIVAILNVPPYVLIRTQLEAFLTEYAQANLESESFKDSEREIVRANEIAQLLSQTNKYPSFSSIIAELENISGDTVSITEVGVSKTTEGLAPIVIQGTATTRLALTTFVENLEAHELFMNVELPLSNLARDRDITFNIKVTPQP